jgi:anti-sigma-K factor RskA
MPQGLNWMGILPTAWEASQRKGTLWRWAIAAIAAIAAMG